MVSGHGLAASFSSAESWTSSPYNKLNEKIIAVRDAKAPVPIPTPSDQSVWELKQQVAFYKHRARSFEERLAVYESAQRHWLQISAPPVQDMVHLAVKKERQQNEERCQTALRFLQAKVRAIFSG